VGEGEGKKARAREVNPASLQKAAQQFSRRKKLVVQATTAVLKCHFAADRNAIESLVA
jgi:hypothetical protein